MHTGTQTLGRAPPAANGVYVLQGWGGTWLAKLDLTVVGMHWLKSASSKIMAGFLPPSSSESRLQCGALLSVMRWAVSVLPVKEIRGTSGWHTRASPALAPVPNTTFTTPGGTPDGNKGTQSLYPPGTRGVSLHFVLSLKLESYQQLKGENTNP